jgi:hypothetical protein
MCVHTHLIDPMDIHFLRCVRDNKRIGTHDAVYDTFGTIAWDVGFDMGWKQLHALFSTTFNCSHEQVNIVLTKDNICILADIIIVDSTRVDVFFWSFKDLPPSMQLKLMRFKPKKIVIMTNTPLINFSL